MPVPSSYTQDYIKYLESYKGSRADAAIDFIKQMEKTAPLTEDKKKEIFSRLQLINKDYVTKDEAEKQYFIKQMSEEPTVAKVVNTVKSIIAGDAAEDPNVKEVAKKYEGFPVDQLAKVYKNNVEAIGDIDKAAEQTIYQVAETPNMTQETLNKIGETLGRMSVVFEPDEEKPSKYTEQLKGEIIKYRQDLPEDVFKELKSLRKEGQLFRETGSPIGEPLYIPEGFTAGQVSPSYMYSKTLSIQKAKAEKINKYLDVGVYNDAVDYIAKNNIQDIDEAVKSYTYEKYGATGLPEKDKSRIATAIAEAARYAVPKMQIANLPSIRDVAEQYAQTYGEENIDYDKVAESYFTSLAPILDASNLSEDEIREIARNVINVGEVLNKEKGRSKITKTILDFLSLPMTNAWTLGLGSDVVDAKTKKALGDVLASMYGDESLQYEFIDPRFKRWAEFVGVNGLLAVVGAAGAKTGVQAVRQFAYEFTDSALMGGLSLSKAGVKGAKILITKQKVAEEMLKKDSEFAKMAQEAAEYLGDDYIKMLEKGADKRDVEAMIKEYFVDKKYREGIELNPEDLFQFSPEYEKVLAGKIEDVQTVSQKAKIVEPDRYTSELLSEEGSELVKKMASKVKRAKKNIPEVERTLEAQPAYTAFKQLDELENMPRALAGGFERTTAEELIRAKAFRDAEEELGEALTHLKNTMEVQGANDLKRGFMRKVFKTMGTAMKELFGVQGDFAAFTLGKINREAEIVFAEQNASKTIKFLSMMREYKDIFAKQPVKMADGFVGWEHNGVRYSYEAFGKLADTIRNSTSLEKIYNEAAYITAKHQIGKDAKFVNAEGVSEFSKRFNEMLFKDLGEQAEKRKFTVEDRQLARRLKVTKVSIGEGEGWKIVDFKTGKTIGKFPTEQAAKDFREMKIKRPFKAIENYRPLYLDRARLTNDKEIPKIADIILNDKAAFEDLIFEDTFNETRTMLDKICAAKYKKKWFDMDDDERLLTYMHELKNTAELRTSLYNNMKSYFSSYIHKMTERKYGHLEAARHLRLPEELYKVSDLYAQDMDYMYMATKRITEAKYLGTGDELLYAIKNQIENRYGAASANKFEQYVNKILGRDNVDMVYDNILAGLSTYQMMTKMHMSGLAQLQQLAYAPARGSMMSFLKGVTALATKGRKEEINKIQDQIGLAIMEIRGFHKREELGLYKAARLVAKASGLEYLDMLSRRVAASTGYYYLEELCGKFAKDPKKYAKYLLDLDINPAEIVANGGMPTELHIRKAMNKFEIDTNFRNEMLDLPEFVSSRTGKFLFALQRTTMRQAKFVKDFVYDELKKGNPYPLINLVTVGSVTSIPRHIVRKFMSGEDVEPDVIKQMIDVGVVFGIYGNMLESLEYGLLPLGANVSTAQNAVRFAQAVLKGDLGRAFSTALREMPLEYKMIKMLKERGDIRKQMRKHFAPLQEVQKEMRQLRQEMREDMW